MKGKLKSIGVMFLSLILAVGFAGVGNSTSIVLNNPGTSNATGARACQNHWLTGTPRADGLNGYVTVSASSSGYKWVRVTRWDNFGRIIWQYDYGMDKNLYAVSGIIECHDGGFATAGYVTSNGLMSSFVIRLDFQGTVKWARTYSDGDSSTKLFAHMQTTEGDDNYIVWSAKSDKLLEYDIVVVKLDDATGDPVWARYYYDVNDQHINDTYYEYPEDIDKDSAGNYVVLGRASARGATPPNPQLGHGGSDVLLYKIQPNGTPLWLKSYGQNYRDLDPEDPEYNNVGEYPLQMIVVEDDNIVVAGRSDVVDRRDAQFFKTDSSGNVLWNKVWGYNLTDTTNQQPYGLTRLLNGNYVFAVNSEDFDPVEQAATDYDMVHIALDPGGNFVDGKRFWGADPANPEAKEFTGDEKFTWADATHADPLGGFVTFCYSNPAPARFGGGKQFLLLALNSTLDIENDPYQFVDVDPPEDLPLIVNAYDPLSELGEITYEEPFTRDDVTSFVMAVCGDTDGDAVLNYDDNCPLTANPGQQDTDTDGYGNACDCDLDNDGAVGPPDFMIFRPAWGSTSGDANWNPDADFDANDAVGPSDFSIFRGLWGDVYPWY